MKKEEFELNSLSSQMPLTDVHNKCPSIPCSVSWRRFENLVIILITVLNVFFIGILFPMISTSIYKLDKLEHVHNLLKQTLGERDTKQNMFEQKIDNITSNQKKHQEKLENFDGMFVLIYFLLKSLLKKTEIISKSNVSFIPLLQRNFKIYVTHIINLMKRWIVYQTLPT